MSTISAALLAALVGQSATEPSVKDAAQAADANLEAESAPAAAESDALPAGAETPQSAGELLRAAPLPPRVALLLQEATLALRAGRLAEAQALLGRAHFLLGPDHALSSTVEYLRRTAEANAALPSPARPSANATIGETPEAAPTMGTPAPWGKIPQIKRAPRPWVRDPSLRNGLELTELYVAATFHSILGAVVFTQLADNVEISASVLAGLGTITGAVIGVWVLDRRFNRLKAGAARGIGLGLAWGSFYSLAAFSSVGSAALSPKVGRVMVWASGLAAAAVGGIAGQSFDVSAEDFAVMHSGLIWGAAFGLLGANGFGNVGRGRNTFTGLFVGMSAGMIAGAAVSTQVEISRVHSLLIDVGGLVGLIAGSAFRATLTKREPRDPDPSNLPGALLSAATTAAGMGLAVLFTRNMAPPSRTKKGVLHSMRLSPTLLHNPQQPHRAPLPGLAFSASF